MAYYLPELDRMSKALSRLETALLTHRRPNFDGDENDDLHAENQKLRMQCEMLKKQLYDAQHILSEILDDEIADDNQGVDDDDGDDGAAANSNSDNLD